jgi:hypothetical protein
MNAVFGIWRESLQRLLNLYETRRGRISVFYPKLFVFFIVLNIACYWWALLTAYAGYTSGDRMHFFQIQFPVGILGALFDSLSFFITVWIVRRALRTRGNLEYVGHLCIDIIIAILATFWVLLVFTVSGWFISLFDARPIQELAVRQERYEELVVRAVEQPRENVRNIYFGFIMGVSTSLPTCVHIMMFLGSLVIALFRKLRPRPAGT